MLNKKKKEMIIKEAIDLVRTQKEGSYEDLKKQVGLSNARRLLCLKVIELKETRDDYRWKLVEEKGFGKIVRAISNFLGGVFGKRKNSRV